MFKDIEKLSKIGTVIIGNGNNPSNNFFCFWQSSNSFDFTNGLLTDLELSEYNFVASALEDCKCIPFARGNTPVEAYEKMINIFDKYFDEDGNWISFDYYYGNFITSAAEIKGYIDFSCNKEDNFDFFNTLKKYPESYEKIANLVVNKYAETKNIENVKNYFIDELDQFITTSMIEKIIEYVVNDKSTKTVHNEIMPGWTTCPECKKIDKTTYGQIDWDLYYKTRQSLYKCDRCNIAYSQSGNKLKRLKKIGKNK